MKNCYVNIIQRIIEKDVPGICFGNILLHVLIYSEIGILFSVLVTVFAIQRVHGCFSIEMNPIAWDRFTNSYPYTFSASITLTI